MIDNYAVTVMKMIDILYKTMQDMIIETVQHILEKEKIWLIYVL